MLVYFSKSGLAAYFLPASLPLPSDVTLPLQETSCDIYTPTNKLAAWWQAPWEGICHKAQMAELCCSATGFWFSWALLCGIGAFPCALLLLMLLNQGLGSKQQVRPYRVRKVKQATAGRNYFLASAVCACDPGANFQPGKTSDSKTIITLQRILLQLEITSFYQRKCESRKATGSIRSTFPI